MPFEKNISKEDSNFVVQHLHSNFIGFHSLKHARNFGQKNIKKLCFYAEDAAKVYFDITHIFLYITHTHTSYHYFNTRKKKKLLEQKEIHF